ncbi:MAG: DNA primase [Deltaproteobacteria bacterium]|nr:DNA primase [Deltaproteobacteria bacterium]
MISQSKIEEIRERADIVDVISESVPLRKKGKNYLGLCPFHSEKTPSFTVNDEKKIFYCFGCNTGGSVITFLMKHEGFSFPDALKHLAGRYGIKIVEEKHAAGDKREEVYSLLAAAAEFFMKELRSPAGEKARRYLKERGYEGGILERFSIGFAPAGWERLTGYLRGKGFNCELAQKIGLLGRKEDRYYDYFRGRIIFPITDTGGRTVGFGGRSIDGGEPKYLNSPESPVFKKGETLYAFHQAKQSIGKTGYVIVVEGYFDLLALHLHGFTNSVATMGTALTKEHIRRLKPYAGCVYTLFDGDEAGKKATLRGLDIFLDADMPAKAVALPAGCDPDEFLKKNGKGPMEKAIGSAEPIMEFFLKDLEEKVDMRSAGGKGAYLDASIPYLIKVENAAERGHYAERLSRDLGIAVKAVYSAMEGASKGGFSPSGTLKKGIIRSTPDLAETTVLKVILRHPLLYSEKTGEAFALFKDPFLKEVAGCVGSFLREGKKEPSLFLDAIEDERIRGFVAENLLKKESGFFDSPEKMLDDCTRKILNAGKPRETTRELIKELEAVGKEELARKILERVTDPKSYRGNG